MSFFNPFRKTTKKIKLTKIEILIRDNPHLLIMNKSTVISSWGDDKIWLNPSLQSCFNSGWYTKQDFIDWSNGIGKIVKGDTTIEKAAVMKYAVLYANLPLKLFIALESDIELNLEKHNVYKIETLGFIDDNNVKYPVGSDELIEAVMSNYAGQIYKELLRIYEYVKVTSSNHLYDIEATQLDVLTSNKFVDRYTKYINEVHHELYGVLSTLSIMGHGFYGACNTPTVIHNFTWASDWIIGYGYKEMLKHIGFELPDIELIKKNRYK